MPLVSISDQQRQPLPRMQLGWHGASRAAAATSAVSMPRPRGDYVAFLGRISPEKRPDRAIEIARRAGMKHRDRRQSRHCGSATISASRSSRCSPAPRRVCRRNRREREVRFPRQCARTAVSHRLAGTVRTGDDRSDVLWHALRGVERGFGTGNHPGGANGYIVDSIDCAVPRCTTRCAGSARRSGLLPAALLGGTHDARLSGYLSAHGSRKSGRVAA